VPRNEEPEASKGLLKSSHAGGPHILFNPASTCAEDTVNKRVNSAFTRVNFDFHKTFDKVFDYTLKKCGNI